MQITKMACGVKHTAVINTENELICFGSNEYGQCGDGKHGVDLIKKNFEPNLHLHGKIVEMVACGGAHTLIKTSSQEVYSFGLNNKG
jgi:alpha-tubulin suppressor-like RCC1 family protein